MKPETGELWAKHDHHRGDRWRRFRAVAEGVDARVDATGAIARASTVFYPGSYVDIAPSFVFGSVTYLDTDKRTPGFFGDTGGIREIVAEYNGPSDADFAFIHADYTREVDLPGDHFDLLVSLYAGFNSEHCTQHLRLGGMLLVNASHGDVAMASIDPRYELMGVVTSVNGEYTVTTSELDSYLIPKKSQPATISSLHGAGKEIAYTRSPFAYLFTRGR